jgi:hypothetical protein
MQPIAQRPQQREQHMRLAMWGAQAPLHDPADSARDC